MLEQNKSFTQFFSKNCGFPKGKALGAHRSGRNFIVQALFGEFENLSARGKVLNILSLHPVRLRCKDG